MQKKHLIFANLFILICALTYLACTKDPVTKADSQSEVQQSTSSIEASDRSVAFCTTGDCNFTVQVLSVTPAGSLFAFDINRYFCQNPNDIVCETLFNQATLPIGTSATFPVAHDSKLGFIGYVANSQGAPISGNLVVRLTSPNGTSQNITLISNSSTEVFRSVLCPGLQWRRSCSLPSGGNG